MIFIKVLEKAKYTKNKESMMLSNWIVICTPHTYYIKYSKITCSKLIKLARKDCWRTGEIQTCLNLLQYNHHFLDNIRIQISKHCTSWNEIFFNKLCVSIHVVGLRARDTRITATNGLIKKSSNETRYITHNIGSYTQ